MGGLKENFYKLEFIWKIIVVICAAYISIFVPLQLNFHLEHDLIFFISGAFVTGIFLLDIGVNIYKYGVVRGQLDFEENIGLKRYFKIWFAVDLIAALPYELIFGIPSLQIIRLLKLIKVAKFFKKWRQYWIKYSTVLMLFFFVFWMSIIAHWMSMGWLAIVKADPLKSDFENYVDAFYWCVTTLTTVGYGDITPVGVIQKMYTILIEIMGVGVYGYLIGNIASILAKKDPARMHYQENIEKLSAMVRYRHIPWELQTRLRNYYAYLWHKKMGYDEDSFLDGLPHSLKSDVSMSLKKEILEKIHLFKDAGENFLRDISMKIQAVVFTPGDYVTRQGEIGEEMYFVVRGRIGIFQKDEELPVAILSDGDFFGEISLFMNMPRTASVKALSYCDMYTLHKRAFDFVVAKYPDVATKIEKEAIRRHNLSQS